METIVKPLSSCFNKKNHAQSHSLNQIFHAYNSIPIFQKHNCTIFPLSQRISFGLSLQAFKTFFIKIKASKLLRPLLAYIAIISLLLISIAAKT